MNDLNIRDLRKVLCWCFASTSVMLLLFPLRRISLQTYRHSRLPALPVLLYAMLLLGESIIFGIAWWTVWKERPSARGWGITASLAYFVFFSCYWAIIPSRSIWDHHWGALVLGTCGMVAFLRSDEQHDARTGAPQ